MGSSSLGLIGTVIPAPRRTSRGGGDKAALTVGEGNCALITSAETSFAKGVAQKMLHERISGHNKGRSRAADPSPANGKLIRGNLAVEAALQLLVEIARRAGNINSARNPALAIFHALDDARRLAALGTIRALACVHHLLTVRCFCDLRANCHGSSPDSICAQRSARFRARMIVDGMS